VTAIVPAVDDDRSFAHDLTRDNMAPYYASHGRTWDSALFDASWPQTENYCLLEDGRRIGVLRLLVEANALYVSDLQVLPASQSRGAGTVAMQFVEQRARGGKAARIRLRVFDDNRAQAFYRRLGFREVARERGALLFEKACR
jgi:ribosomal protein S18 acetylase RimI-like enzyme